MQGADGQDISLFFHQTLERTGDTYMYPLPG